MTDTKRRRAAIGAALTMILLPLALAGCSDADDTRTAGDVAAGVGAKWGSCMRDAGFTVQDPSDDDITAGLVQPPDGTDTESFIGASTTCRETAGVPALDTADRQEWEREYVAVATCIRDEYPDFPEQEPGGIGVDDDYPHAGEPAFEQTFTDCLEEFSPDTQNQSVG